MTGCACELDEAAELERQTLRVLVAINAVMFLVELIAGWVSESTGLLADSLDMFADASVYGIVLYAAGRSGGVKLKAASLSGVVQIVLGLGVLVEVVRRLALGSEPISLFMIGVGLVAFAANLTCVWLIAKHRDGEIHMRAAWIFSANDALANLGVIVSGGLVLLLGSRLPDLIVGAAISVVVILGGIHILREARAEGARAAGV
jgi:cation diffusion facilitator family transporter